MKLATAEQMKELDRRAIEERGIPSLKLMERAAEGVCAGALELLGGREPGKSRAAVFCGSGNNGGDGLAAARLLFLAGVRVRAFLVGSYDKLTPDAQEMTRRLSECGIELEPFEPENEEQERWVLGCHVLVDAIFGIGLSREIAPESRYAAAIDLINRAPAKVVAADIASGVETNTGSVLGCGVMADKTVTFTLKKIGNVVSEGSVYAGDVTVQDIGIPQDLVRELRCPIQTVEKETVRAMLPARKADGHKGTFGKLLIVGGAVGYTGAPYLTASAALRTGCGLVYLGVPEKIWAVEAQKCTAAMPFPLPDTKDGKLREAALDAILKRLEGCDVLALGPGLGRSKQLTSLVCQLLRRTKKPMILDADGINALEGHIDVLKARQGRSTILTPHDGEFARLSGRPVGRDRAAAAREFARAYGCVLVLKGHRTITALPQGNLLVNTTGNSGMAKGGSGDVLTGILAALICQGATPAQAAACGVWLHGRAGDLAAAHLTEYGMTPPDLVEALPQAFREITGR